MRERLGAHVLHELGNFLVLVIHSRECSARACFFGMVYGRDRAYFEVLEVGVGLGVRLGIGEDDVLVGLWRIRRLRHHDQLHCREERIRRTRSRKTVTGSGSKCSRDSPFRDAAPSTQGRLQLRLVAPALCRLPERLASSSVSSCPQTASTCFQCPLASQFDFPAKCQQNCRTLLTPRKPCATTSSR